MNRISRVSKKKNAAVHVAHSRQSNFVDKGDKIIQVVPVSVPTYVLYETEDAVTEEVVNYLALTELGDLRPLLLNQAGYFDFADDCKEYLSMYEDLG